MAKERTWSSDYFYGNKISDEGLRRGYIDYATLAKSFDHILNNTIMEITEGYFWEIMNGDEFDEEGNYREVFQWYIITENGARILQEWTDELVYYNEETDLWMWGVTHWGTSWDYVLTDIKIVKEEQ